MKIRLLAGLAVVLGGCAPGPAAVDPAEIPTADPISGVNPLVAEGLTAMLEGILTLGEAAIRWISALAG